MTLKEKNLILLYFKHLHRLTPAKRPEKSGRSCYNASRKSSGKASRRHKEKCNPAAESWKQQRGTTKMAKVGTPNVARVSRRAVSPFVCLARGHRISRATYLRTTSHHNHSTRLCPSRLIRAKTHESNEIAPAMWGVLTRVRPARSTQTIENKRAILRHRARAPRKQGKYPV